MSIVSERIKKITQTNGWGKMKGLYLVISSQSVLPDEHVSRIFCS